MESGIYNEHLEETLFIMAETSLRERDTAAIEMHDAIRQVKKYLSSCNPSIKILKQKLSKVSEKGEEAKRCHFANCRKAKIELQTEGATLFIAEMPDYITDCVDDGLLYIEQRELDELSKNKLSGDAAVEEEKRLVKMSKSTRLMSQLKTDGLLRSEISSARYKEQFNDFIERGVFCKLSKEEMDLYSGPSFVVTHKEVLKEGSTSTPVRLVINSSLQSRGRNINDILMKGPNTLNGLYGVEMRFRSYPVPLVCDIAKMYHSIKTTTIEKHLRTVLWRDLDQSEPVQTYGIETVMFGDRPAATIATTAVQQTARIYEHTDKKAAEKIVSDSYVDDILTGEEDFEAVESLESGI